MKLVPVTYDEDRARVAALFDRAADYVRLERGTEPSAVDVEEFFNDLPPGLGPNDALQFSVDVEGVVVGLVTCCFGYPEPGDNYIGLMMFDPAHRGRGLGARALDALTRIAESRGATRQLVAVLEANQKGRAFWERQGFVVEEVFEPSADDHRRFRMARTI
ncbi:MAG: GNAT family N-acetyltransferase [Pseudomonadota bacterium]